MIRFIQSQVLQEQQRLIQKRTFKAKRSIFELYGTTTPIDS
jgi:hypothetical protein